jgi:GST-like protein
MMTVYAFSTPNSVRVPIALEELQLEYEIRPVNVRKGEQKLPDFLTLILTARVPCWSIPRGRAENHSR